MKFFTKVFPLMVTGMIFAHVSLCSVISQAKKKPRTSVCLQDVMEERCDIFNEKTNGSWNCKTITSTFVDSFAFKGPCDLSADDFSTYLTATNQTIPIDKTMLWSGRVVKVRAMKFSSRCNFVTLSHTLTGCQPDEVQFCGQKKMPGVNYFECDNCENSNSTSSYNTYWRAVSMNIAKQARGVVPAILSSKRDYGAYNPSRENCSRGTVLELLKKIESMGFKATCISNDTAIEKVCEDSKASGSTADFYLCAGGKMDKPTTQAILVSLFLSLILNQM